MTMYVQRSGWPMSPTKTTPRLQPIRNGSGDASAMRRSTRRRRSPSRSVAVGAPEIRVQRTELASACVSSQHTSRSAAVVSTMSEIRRQRVVHARHPFPRQQIVGARQPDERHRHLLELAGPATDVGEPAELRGQQQRGVDVVDRHRLTFRDRDGRTLRQWHQQPCALVVDCDAPRTAAARQPTLGRPAPRPMRHAPRVAPSPC